jgi:hypothetical protein
VPLLRGRLSRRSEGSADEASTVFEIASERSHDPYVVEVARAAWRLSRNPMALLLPIVWSAWNVRSKSEVRDDVLPPVEWIGGIPDYALDQFTRVGKLAIRMFILQDTELQAVLCNAGVGRDQLASVAGDLLFLVEGGPCVRRKTWQEARELSYPARWLPGTALLGQHLEEASSCLVSKAEKLRQLRQQLFHRSQSAKACMDVQRWPSSDQSHPHPPDEEGG